MKKIYSIICKRFLPLWSLEFLYQLRCKLFFIFAINELGNYSKNNPEFLQQYKKELTYISTHKKIELFNYNWSRQLKGKDISVYFNIQKKMHYVLVDGNKPLYYPRRWSKDWIQFVHKALLIEALPQSPHRYFEPSFSPGENDIFLDIGSAEGIISLLNIDTVQKVILFETDPEWLEALQATFAPYKQKVCIINKFVSNTDSKTTITLDTFSENFRSEDQSFFIKCDIEGNEMSFLQGASKFLNSTKQLKLVICTYHKMNDEINIKKFFNNRGLFEISETNNYMIFPPYKSKEFRPPYFKKGLLRIIKSGE